MAHEIEELLPAYALGAVDADERARVDAHLPGCASCQQVLSEYKQVTEGLLHAAGSKAPDASLRASLERQTAPRAQRRLSFAPAGAAIAVGALALTAINVGLLLQARQLFERTAQGLAQQQAWQSAVAIGSYPSSQVAVIEDDGARGTFVYDPGLPVGVLYIWGLEPPPAGRAYQAWLIDEAGSRTSGGLLTFGDSSEFAWLTIRAPAAIEGYVGLGLTEEPAAGSPAPTGERILGTDL